MADPQPSAAPNATLTGASQLPLTSSYYANGFSLSLSNADAHAIFLMDGQPILKINMSFTTAKTLARYLDDMMKKLESVTGREIMITNQIEDGLQRLAGEQNK